MKICNRIKKNFRRKLTAALVAGMMAFSVGFGSVSAADVVNITLDETIQRAFENNRSIKESVAEREQAFWSLSEARRQTNPQLSWSLNAQKFGGDYYRYYDYHRSFSHTAGISVPIYQGGRLKEGRKYARWGLSNADLSLEDTMQTVRLQSTIYYFNVLQYRNLIEVYEEEVVTLQEHLRNVNAQFRVGTVAKVDVLESQVELANAQQNLVNIQNQYDVAVAELNNYIGLPADTVVRPQDTLTYKKYPTHWKIAPTPQWLITPSSRPNRTNAPQKPAGVLRLTAPCQRVSRMKIFSAASSATNGLRAFPLRGIFSTAA